MGEPNLPRVNDADLSLAAPHHHSFKKSFERRARPF